MKLLLDTHTFLWFIDGDTKLNSDMQRLIEDPENECFLSIASLWEMAIKISIDKLTLELSFTKLVSEQIENNSMKLLNISPLHLDFLKNLPFHHKDPFDRLIISQGQSENIPVLSRDASFDKYNIQRIWL